MKRLLHLLAVLPVVAGLLMLPTLAHATAGQRLDLKVLLLSSGGDPQLGAWRTTLDALGVPYDTFVRSGANPVTPATLQVDSTHGRYNAVIVTDGTMRSNWSPMPAAEAQALTDYETTFGVREIADNGGPASGFGLDYANQEGSPTTLGVSATLSTAGRAVFPYLDPSLTIPYEDGLYMYLAVPATATLLSAWNSWGVTDVTSFQTLVQGPTVTGSNPEPDWVTPVTGPASIVGVATHADGREQMVTTVNSGSWSTSDKLLHVGMLDWATRGLYLGYWRSYFTMHFDDVFSADDRWSSPTLVEPAKPPTIRMSAADAARAAQWSAANGIRLDLVFNGQSASPTNASNGVKKGQNDALTTALLARTSSFGWISHTWSHADLDAANANTINTEISKNVNWASVNHVPINPAELVTGGHTGLTNPLFPAAARKAGVTTVASDASLAQWSTIQPLGALTVVPRHPTWLAYDVGTRAEQVDEFFARNIGWTGGPATWDHYVDIAARDILGSVVSNDPRPFFAHQNNLAEEGTFYPVADAMLATFHGWFSVPLLQPTMTQAATLLLQQKAWRAALTDGAVSAYLLDGRVHVQVTRALSVPVSGTTAGTVYDGVVHSGWVSVTPTQEVVLSPA